MKIYIHYEQQFSTGYVPRVTLRLYNVESVTDKGTCMVQVKMQFSDENPIHDHVIRVVCEPDTE